MERKCTFFRKTNERYGIQASALHELQGCEDCGCLLSLGLLICTVVNSAGSNLFTLCPAIIKFRVVCFLSFLLAWVYVN